MASSVGATLNYGHRTMTKRKAGNLGRTTDLTLSWVIQLYGKEWETWRSFGEEWLRLQDKALSTRLQSIYWFLESYLIAENITSDPSRLICEDIELPDLNECMGRTYSSPQNIAQRVNYIVAFVDWVITNHFSDDRLLADLNAEVRNPFTRHNQERNAQETVWNPLPYTYVRELRSILCPPKARNFREWKWAYSAFGENNRFSWVEVDSYLVRPQDPDCVWRERTKYKDGKPETVTEIWSPVSAVLLLVKLNLPLRTYQLRMIDSGESDTNRYEGGLWIPNEKHNFVRGTNKTPWQKGVFRQIRTPDTGEWMTGLYVNTNKTADQNRDCLDRGYVIPWEHTEVLFWLNKLRNWQETYNPINTPTCWEDLEYKHIGSLKSKNELKQMGDACFLFRDPTGNSPYDHDKPITTQKVVRHWYALLSELEKRVAARGQKLADGSRLRFVKQYEEKVADASRIATEYPLHSLRVSLITSYAMDGDVPLPVLSKLLAGHSRLVMTVYYTKINPSVMNQKMSEAEVRIEKFEQDNLKSFLADASISQIKHRTAHQDIESINAIMANRNPVGWVGLHIGLCLAGGNSSTINPQKSVAGCWNGGDLIATQGAKDGIYGPVPHGPENCVRCRWFLTDARYLNALRSHFNCLSYQATLAARLAVKYERERDQFEDARYEAEQSGRPFSHNADLLKAERRFEKQIVEADEYAKDLRACFKLIKRIIAIESGRSDDDDRQKLIAVGDIEDLRHPISLVETESELWQLCDLCEDAEIYPEVADSLKKSPAIEKRSRILNKYLIDEGYEPLLMNMDEDMQLIAGNAFIRALAKQSAREEWRIAGFQHVTGMIEAGQSMERKGLLDVGIDSLCSSLNESEASVSGVPILSIPSCKGISNDRD